MMYAFIVLFVLFLMALAFISIVILKDQYNRPISCYVIAENAPIHTGPSEIFHQVGKKSSGIVNVIGAKGNWWKLSDGTYMPARCLTPMRSGEMPKELK